MYFAKRAGLGCANSQSLYADRVLNTRTGSGVYAATRDGGVADAAGIAVVPPVAAVFGVEAEGLVVARPVAVVVVLPAEGVPLPWCVKRIPPPRMPAKSTMAAMAAITSPRRDGPAGDVAPGVSLRDRSVVTAMVVLLGRVWCRFGLGLGFLVVWGHPVIRRWRPG